jgi:outer membrane protein assembly factor BamB
MGNRSKLLFWLKLWVIFGLLSPFTQAQASGFSLAWQFNGGDGWAEHPIIYKGVVYVPWTDGRLTAHDLATGKLLHSLAGVNDATAPFVVGNFIYSTNDDGMHEISLDAFQITRKIEIPNAWYTENVPYDAETGFFIARQAIESEYKGKLTAFRLSDGGAVWSFPKEYEGGFSNHQNPIVVGDSVFFQSTNSYWKGSSMLYRLDKKTGQVIWSQTLSTIEGDSTSRGGYNNPIYDQEHDVLYVTESWNRGDARVYALQRGDGKLLWKQDVFGKTIESTLTYYDNQIFLPLHVFSGHGSYMALSAADGKVIWEEPGFYKEDGWSATGVDDKYLYRTTHGGGQPHLIVQDRQSGALAWSLAIDAPADCFNPVFSSGMVLLGSESSVYAVRIGKGLPVNSDFHGYNASGYNPGAVNWNLKNDFYLPMVRLRQPR